LQSALAMFLSWDLQPFFFDCLDGCHLHSIHHCQL
jgi:hypothetical protein